MQAKKATEQRNDSHQDNKARSSHGLDSRYGRIGISAVAAAVSHKGEKKPRPDSTKHTLVYERD